MTTGFVKPTIGAVVLLAAFLEGGNALATPLKVVKGSADPGIQARITTNSLGALKVPSGSVKFNGSNVSVGAVPDWLFDRHVVLTGKLIEHRISTAEGKTSIQGLIYFLGGDWVNSFPDNKQPDNVGLADGSFLVGRVRAVNGDNIDFQVQTGQTRRIKLSDIKTVTSPRAIAFNIPATDVKVDATSGDIQGDATTGNFDATVTKISRKMFAKKDGAPVEPKSVLAGSEGGVTKGQLTTMIVLDAVNVIAPAIVAPLVAPLGDKGAVNKLHEVSRQSQLEQASGH